MLPHHFPPPPPPPPFGPPHHHQQPLPILTSSDGKHVHLIQQLQNPHQQLAPPPPSITREEVIRRIEATVVGWLAILANPDVSTPPTFEVTRRTASNVQLQALHAYPPAPAPAAAHAAGAQGEEEDDDDDEELPPPPLPPPQHVLVHGDAVVIKRLRGGSARGYAAIFGVLAFVHRLLLAGKRATSRELYYHVKTAACFKSQGDADSAVQDVASILGVASRHDLGIVGAAKGLLAGRLRFRSRQLLGGGGAAAAAGQWQACGAGAALVDSDWITEVMEIELETPAWPPRCILVVEKECVFQRLLADSVLDTAGSGVVMVTGKGYPDLSTRACVKALAEALRVPVVGLCDCNPHGVALLLTYKLGSSTTPESRLYATPSLRWLGLRPTQVVGRMDLSESAFQAFKGTDRAKCRSLLESPFAQANRTWRREVEVMLEEGMKLELEALSSVPSASGRGGALVRFVQRALLQGDYI